METLISAYQLIHEGVEALAEVEEAGMRIDVPYLKQAIADTSSKIKVLESELKGMEEYTLQRKRFGLKTNLTSRQQLAKVLYEDMDHRSTTTTASGRVKLDETALSQVGTPYTTKFLELEKNRKLEGTYLKGVLRETEDGYLHPFFNLHLATTYRSSSNQINFQNIPIRDPAFAEIIRSAFIPRDGHVLVETDYAALEFRVAACFWKDPAMVSYASNPDKDIHRDVAAEIFICDRDEVNKKARYCGKNMFVFPQIYGDFYINNAKNCWEAMESMDLKVGAVPMKGWLENKGIRELGECDTRRPPRRTSFERHMKDVEKRFYEWFPDFKKSKEVWWAQYKQKGYFDVMTGFRVSGVYRRNYVFNCPIQGPAFHLLLWSLTRMVRWLKKQRMRTKIIGQIHDSIVADVYEPELDDYIAKAREVMTVDVRKRYDWIITPMDIEVEVARENWFHKQAI